MFYLRFREVRVLNNKCFTEKMTAGVRVFFVNYFEVKIRLFLDGLPAISLRKAKIVNQISYVL